MAEMNRERLDELKDEMETLSALGYGNSRQVSNTADLLALVEELAGALKNSMGYLDTPIGRRKLGISPNAGWLVNNRVLLSRLDARHG